MKRALFFFAVLLGLGALSAFAADAPVAKPATPRGKLLGIEEMPLAEGESIKVAENQALFPFEGRPASAFYIVVKVSRELIEKTSADVRGFDVALASGSGVSLKPYAVAAWKRSLDGDTPTYASNDKRRWTSEVYYFAVAPGQRDWQVTINNEVAGRVLDYYATLIVRSVDDAALRVKLPDGSQAVVNGNQVQKLVFPAGSGEAVAIEVRGKGKTTLPWRKFDKGDVKYVAVAGDLRNAPILPAENLRKALLKINRGWQMFHQQKGVGGGGYNIAPSGEPVHVGITFGKDGVAGGISNISADGVRVDYLLEEPVVKSGRKPPKDGPWVIRYADAQSNAWRVEPWEKVVLVDISDDAKKIVGQTTCGRFVIRSTESSPSLWDQEGLLQKGQLFEKDFGMFHVVAKQEEQFVVVWGVEAK